jgi:isopentenyl diphosphate isomerase/L-lactate dehydrogenase-like FMN-dependent dehydrogenase
MGGIAGGFLQAATKSSEEVVNLIDELILELRIVMFSVGAGTIEQLKKSTIHKVHAHD